MEIIQALERRDTELGERPGPREHARARQPFWAAWQRSKLAAAGGTTPAQGQIARLR
jgi:hypothetical protein